MAADATITTTLSFTVKLIINTRQRRVVFAETTRDAVYFLYSLLDSPDTPFSFDEETWDGCTSNLADTVQELDDLDDNLPPPPRQPARDPSASSGAGASSAAPAATATYVAERSGARCPSCGGRMDAEAPRGAPGAGCSASSAQAPLTTCALMDDLTIWPSPGAALAVVISRVGADALQEATVQLGHEEALETLEASLESSTVLTDVFLQEKAPAAAEA